MKRGLLSLKASSQIDATQALPDRLLFLKWGANPSRYGDIHVNEVTLAAVPANQKKAKFDHVVIDFQHNSVPGSPFYKGEPVTLAARKCAVEVVKDEGIYLTGIDWIADAETLKSYVDLSLCPKVDENNNVVFVHSGAVCRQGEVEGITLPLSADPFNPAGDPDTMYKKLLCAILNLNADSATDAEIEAAAKKFGGDADTKTLSADLKAAIGEAIKPLTAEIAALKGADVKRERDQILALAARDGKVVPLSALPDKDGNGGLDNKALAALVTELPVTVPVEKRTASNILPLSAIAGATNGADEEVRKSLGITEEVWKKHNAK